MTAFRIDEAYDREHGGRYARLVASRVGDFAEAWGDIAPVTFACVAWRLATPPELTPGYVGYHRRVISAACVRNSWDGGLTGVVELAAPWPASLHEQRVWQRDRGWRGWPEAFGQFVSPSDHDLARRPHLRSSLRVDAPLPLDGLPPAPAGPAARIGPGIGTPLAPVGPADEVAPAAARAVAAIVRALNDLLDPLVSRLDEVAGRMRE